jgi:hypothetical protein
MRLFSLTFFYPYSVKLLAGFTIAFPLRAFSVLRPQLSKVSSQRYLLIVQLLSVHRITQVLRAARQQQLASLGTIGHLLHRGLPEHGSDLRVCASSMPQRWRRPCGE